MKSLITTLYVSGLDCPSEEKLIRGQLESIPEVEQLIFNFITQEVTIYHHLNTPEPFLEKIQGLGMKATLKTEREKEHLEENPHPSWWTLGLSGFLAITAEVIAYSLSNEHSPWVALLSLIAMTLSGKITLKKGWLGLRTKTLNISSLMLIAITGAVLIGEWPEAAMVTVLFALAERIEVYSLDKAREAIRKLMEIAPDVATVKAADGSWQNISVNQVVLGDVIWVKPGERIPLDGEIIIGKSSINQAPITGESMPLDKGVGDKVYAGTLNEHGSFQFKVNVAAGDTVLAKIGKTIAQAQAERAPTQRFVDQFAKYYTPLMVIIAVLVAVIPPFFGGGVWSLWLYKALTLLVIACPCALVISTPVTVVSGLAAAAKNGLLIKGGTYLEQGHRLKAIALDKTGTLTEGRPIVTELIELAEQGNYNVLQLAASLDDHSEHPIAQAIVKHWKTKQPEESLLLVTDFKALPGRGVTGLIDNVRYFVGNHQLAEDNQVCNPTIETQLKELERTGQTTIILSDSDQVLAIFAVADTLRSTSQLAIKALHQQGIKTFILTGDNATTAKAIAHLVGIDEVQANVLPTDKLNVIDDLITRYGAVGMVGDGINDAPALAKATIGFAMGKGTDIALETADVAIMNDNLIKLSLFIDLSRKTARVLFQNIGLSIVIKIIFFGLALAGLATLWMAVFADMGASLIVVANGLRLLTFNESRNSPRE
ncbi:TPA: heavy metal translocating P-type ATPase [Legionella pneumophila]|uniref:P-type Zn(2+) transporter n=1 Tax=Legionella moravica TaxID=39962 RepID=A0A378JVM1_9GAMM|nr:heavy metal translocating P-type ATPase [Legionella moravica]HAT7052200.1 heavy metal translocating P-type ATPase [Legionella pneumophila]KTD35479.1 zinc, cobalt and lead efflux system [Legionella moravica]STX62067.1 zinc, cobalt and lead efflux system [Legionella moravica]HAT7054452.1 heavy metal translocating P-type ATPase [Legionella pneumophila]HAT7064345.1 heavy metal translocating P-type ATPase [Legionella pneumophila]